MKLEWNQNRGFCITAMLKISMTSRLVLVSGDCVFRGVEREAI